METKRGYMTREEIEGHVNRIVSKKANLSEYDFLSKKIVYLTNVGKRSGLLSSGTRESVNNVHAGYLKQRADLSIKYAKSNNVSDAFWSAQNEARWYDEASQDYEKAGEYELAISSAKEAANAKYNARWLSPAGSPVFEQDLRYEHRDLERRVETLESKYGSKVRRVENDK